MIARFVWLSLLVLLALVSISVQLDRQSAVVPILAESVPEPARGFAQAQIAAAALGKGSHAEAVREAQLLVQRRPIPAENLRLLAQAQFAAGEAEEGFHTIQIAAQRGWRDAAAQETMLRIASAAGDEAEAARRYTALFLMSGTEDALLEEFGESLFAERGGIAAQTVVEILAGANRWNDNFLRRGARVLPPQSFVDIVAEADARGTRFSCPTMELTVRQLTRRDEAAAERFSVIAEKRC